MPGPIPQRSDQRVRRNEPDIPIEKVTALGIVEVPELNLQEFGITEPHGLVVSMYKSLSGSAQRKYHEPSDWQYARFTMYLVHEMLSSNIDKEGRPKPISSMKIAAIDSMLSKLLMTEGDRRRMRIEIDRDPDAGGKLIDVADMFRKRLGQV